MDAAPAADLIDRGNPIRSWFRLAARKTNIRREVLAGLTTFATMSYILVVNSAILSSVGIDTGVLISVTALAAALNTALMALVTNYPLALAPGMGSNAFLAYQVCSAMHIPWQAAFGLVFYNGILFLILAWSGLRQMVLDSFPPALRVAITCGIGLFIALVGLKGTHVLIANPQSFIGLGNLTSPECLLFFVGLIFNTLLMWRGVRGALILGIFLVTVLGLFLPSSSGHGMVTSWPTAVVAPPVSIEATFLKFDLGYLWAHFSLAFPIVLVLFFGDFMSGIGTTLAVCQRAELLDEHGRLPRFRQVLGIDALAACTGAALGTSTVGLYVESAAGVEAGGRTGLTSLVVAACFLLALPLHPIISIIPAVATAPALMMVGVLMMQSITSLNLRDLSIAVPATVTIIIMAVGNISDGMAIGMIIHVLIMLFSGRAREVHFLTYILGLMFAAHFFFK
jgi:AGZA family xanthine/uracil permease-like MFS transporter